MKKIFIKREASLSCSASRRKKRTLKKRQKSRMDRMFSQGVSKNHLESFKKSLNYARVYLTEDFCMSSNPDGVAKKINEIEILFKKRRPVFIMMTKVKSTDYSALATLLAVMYRFKKSHIDFDGNFPRDKMINEMFNKSGFFDKLFENNTNKTIYQVNADNQFVTQGDDFFFDLNLIDEHIIPATSMSVWGKQKRIPGLRATLLELIDNTKTHASGRDGVDERWWMSINHDSKNKKVSFVFLDYGIGIFSSLSSKDDQKGRFFRLLKEKHGERENHIHLKELLDYGQESVTGEKNRGKGIRGIKLSSERNQISELKITSNQASALVSEDKYTKMKQNFDGTLFYWEIGYSNVNLD